jgi:hypothetical protein
MSMELVRLDDGGRPQHVPGSTYVEANIASPGFSSNWEQYRSSLQQRLSNDSPRTVSRFGFETVEDQVRIEAQLVVRFIRQCGYINLFSFASEQVDENGYVPIHVLAACASFTKGLGLVEKVVPYPGTDGKPLL